MQSNAFVRRACCRLRLQHAFRSAFSPRTSSWATTATCQPRRRRKAVRPRSLAWRRRSPTSTRLAASQPQAARKEPPMSQAKKFASQADLEEKQVTFSQISEHAWAYTAEGDPNTGIIVGDDARAGGRHAGHARDGGRRDPPHPRGDRQADQVRGAHALPRGARARRERLPAAADHRQPGHLRPDRRARRAGQGERDRPLPAPVPQRRDRAARA